MVDLVNPLYLVNKIWALDTRISNQRGQNATLPENSAQGVQKKTRSTLLCVMAELSVISIYLSKFSNCAISENRYKALRQRIAKPRRLCIKGSSEERESYQRVDVDHNHPHDGHPHQWQT